MIWKLYHIFEGISKALFPKGDLKPSYLVSSFEAGRASGRVSRNELVRSHDSGTPCLFSTGNIITSNTTRAQAVRLGWEAFYW